VTMDVAVEISLYPLRPDYLPVIRAFIERLRASPRLRVESTSMSTQIVGEYGFVMQLLSQELHAALAGSARTVVIIKLVGPLDAAAPGAGVRPAAPAN
jgi:uncharacterized protein YqgV (UPF0045/DUF77 family)